MSSRGSRQTSEAGGERWGRLLVTRHAHRAGDGPERAELALRVVTFASRRYPRRRLGAAPPDPTLVAASTVTELREAVDAAVQRELPLLLSPEAAGALGDRVRVARHDRPPRPPQRHHPRRRLGQHATRGGEQAPGALPALRDSGRPVMLDAGARELVAMTLARPLADHPILLGRQREVAALKVLGSGVDASQVGTPRRSVAPARSPGRHHAAAARARDRRESPARPVAPPATGRQPNRSSRVGCRRGGTGVGVCVVGMREVQLVRVPLPRDCGTLGTLTITIAAEMRRRGSAVTSRSVVQGEGGRTGTGSGHRGGSRSSEFSEGSRRWPSGRMTSDEVVEQVLRGEHADVIGESVTLAREIVEAEVAADRRRPPHE